MPHWEHAVVVGASSGIGEAVARQLAADGTIVTLVARRLDLLESIADSVNEGRESEMARVVVADVRDADASDRAFQEVLERGPPLDLIVYSSGIMPKGSREGFPTREDVAAVETNLLGAVVWLNAAARYFQARGHGTIVGIGSIAGDRGRQGNPVYNATKAGLATYLEALRNRLARDGVTVVTIKPGFIRTPLIGSNRVFPPASPADVAAADIIRAARAGRRVAYVPGWWWWVAAFIKIVPSPIMERLPL
ncbi:MAG TPA: SDR family NAD(P)-dependent oxidoreductase [Chloroflexota bacterium]|jgi:short-subunit dehydrogenase|nr:SDR family NAD(P)-dependent oxidoreductase [Chloroflexota bacterium]